MFKQIILPKQRVSYGELKQKQFQFLVDQISKILAHCTIGSFLRHYYLLTFQMKEHLSVAFYCLADIRQL